MNTKQFFNDLPKNMLKTVKVLGWASLGLFLVFLSPISGCGPSKAEIEAQIKRANESKVAAQIDSSFKAEVLKHINDSLKKVKELAAKPAPIQAWYSSKDVHLSTGTVHDFLPKSEVDNTKKFYIIMKDCEGKLTINETNYKVWAILNKGDQVK